MRIRYLKRICFLFMLGISLTLFWNQNSMTAKAATPTFKEKKIEIRGLDETHQLTIKNKVKNSKYKWSSSNKKVATVTNNGLVTSVNKGSAVIKCKITYPSGKTKTLSCDVTVIIPSEDIRINNAAEINGAHIMRVGETYDFNRTLTPSNSSDKTYWSIDTSASDTNPNAIRIDNSSKGIVTALRTGKVILVATAAKEATAKSAKNSEIKDAIIIEVIGQADEVTSAEIINSRTIRVTFGTAIRESTVVNSNGKLSSNIVITPLEGTNGVKAKDPGTFAASLSNNSKVLTITSSNTFNGKYGITFTNRILTSEGKSIYQDYVVLSYSDGSSGNNTDNSTGNTGTNDDTIYDTDAPEVSSIELDGDGMTTIITFKEKMDFTYFRVNDARVASSTTAVQTSTISFLNNETNYNFSSDGKSIRINLSPIDSKDYNKSFVVTISGLRDKAGNDLINGSFDAIIRTDTNPKPQARPISVTRTSYDTITAAFTRSIRDPGYAYINNSGYIYGEVDLDNSRLVHYKLSSYDVTLTGTQKVSIGHWDSYNVISNDTYANQMYDFNVYFTTETVRPVLISYEFNSDLSILTLKYSEDVHLNSSSGYLDAKMASYQYNDSNIGMIEYSEISTVDNVIEIMLKNLTIYGDYTFTIPEGFIVDNYRNYCRSSVVTVHNRSGMQAVSKLAEPYSIEQSEANHSIINIKFADKLDNTSALNVNNYSISGAIVKEVKLINNSTYGSTVQLVLEKGSITTTGKQSITISGIKGYNNSFSEMEEYTTNINLVENTDPELKSIKFNDKTRNTVELTFTEAVKGSMSVTVQERSTGYIIGSTVSVSGDKVIITLDTIPEDGTYLKIFVHNNSITDLNDNESIVNPVLNALVNY